MRVAIAIVRTDDSQLRGHGFDSRHIPHYIGKKTNQIKVAERYLSKFINKFKFSECCANHQALELNWINIFF